MSRTSFAEQFRSVAGVPPLTYLHRWRMLLAQRALRDGDTRVGPLAFQLGYASEAHSAPRSSARSSSRRCATGPGCAMSRRGAPSRTGMTIEGTLDTRFSEATEATLGPMSTAC